MDLPTSEHLTYSGPPTAHRFHAREPQLPAAHSALFAGSSQAAQRLLQGLSSRHRQSSGGTEPGEGGREEAGGGCSCSYPFDGDLHLGDGCWHLGKEQGIRRGVSESSLLHPLLPASFSLPGGGRLAPSLGQCNYGWTVFPRGQVTRKVPLPWLASKQEAWLEAQISSVPLHSPVPRQ